MKGFYFVTDSGLSRRGNISDVKNALAAGVKVVQYREKNLSTKDMLEVAMRLREICKKAAFIINDRVDIALISRADGVHLGQGDLPYRLARKLLGKKRIIGLTVHNIREAEEAQKLGADYLGVSPIFNTRTKKDAGRAAGAALIKKIRKQIPLPIVAIGGINLSNAPQVIDAGADCLCAISAVVAKPDVKSEIEKYQKLWKKH
jgi:thiamine-phosphate pyrophosphorylase